MPDNLSLSNINANTIDIDISGGGTSVTLPTADATANTAGLMSADDKSKILLQGGNSFGAILAVGTKDGFNVALVRHNSTVCTVTSAGLAMASGKGMVNGSSINNASIIPFLAGTQITRDVADANPALIVNQKNASSTGNTLTLQNTGNDQLSISNTGILKVNDLAGTGSRMVTADSTGVLNATTEVTSGTYTPAVAGPATYTPDGFRFTRIGNIVHGGGSIQISGCVVGANKLTFDLPFSTLFSSYIDVTGTVSGINVGTPSTAGVGNLVIAYAPTVGSLSMGEVDYVATDTSAVVFIEFTYIVQ